MRSWKPIAKFIVTSLLTIAGRELALAQTSDFDQLLQTGTPQNSATLAVPLGTVDLSNGNLHLEIPVKTIPQRGGGQPITVKWVYDSQFWKEYVTGSADTGYRAWWQTSSPVGDGWRMVASPFYSDLYYSQQDILDPNCNNSGTVQLWTNFLFMDAASNSHAFTNLSITAIQPSCTGPNVITDGAFADDNSGYYLSITTDQWHSVPAGTAKVWDSSGNLVYTGSAGGGPWGGAVGTYEDANGNIPQLPPSITVGNNPGVQGVTVNRGNYVVNTNFTSQFQYSAYQYSGPTSNPSSIALSDGSTYSFTYDTCPGNTTCQAGQYHYGVLTGVTLPTGATITFGYQLLEPSVGLDVPDLRLTSVSYSGESLQNCAPNSAWSGQTWSLCYHVNSQNSTTTEVDVTLPPDQQSTKNQIVYSGEAAGPVGWFTPVPMRPTSKTIYRGLAASNIILEQDSYSYAGGFMTPQLTAVSSTIAGAGTTKTQYSYWIPGLPMISSKKELDSSGTVQREVDWTYVLPQSSGIYPPPIHYIDRLHTATLYGKGGLGTTPIAVTTYGYDENYPGTTSGTSGHPVTGLASHDDNAFGASTPARGNLTSIKQLVSQGNTITTEILTYNILGEVTQTQDANGNQTKYDYYSSSWGDSTCASTTQFNYPTQITNPLNQVTKNIFNSCDGNVHSTQNPNDVAGNRPGTTYTYDGNQQLIYVSLPDGGWKRITYNCTGLPTIICTQSGLTSSQSATVTTTLDGLGRTSIQTDAAGNSVQTGYTALGQVASVSNPYSTTVGVGIQYTYDPLGRLIKTTNQDGSVRWKCYNGFQDPLASQPNCSAVLATTTTVKSAAESWSDGTDELGRHSQSVLDPLGRMIAVMEPNPSGSGALMETDYTYNPIDDLMTVVQWGGPSGSSGARSRSFNYDALERLKCASNPETNSAACPSSSGSYVSGTTGYMYDNNGNLQSKTTAAVNLTTGNQTINYCYDGLNRLTLRYLSGTCSAPNSILASFGYDGAGVTGATNAIGHLTDERSYAGSTLVSERQFSLFDAMGRPLAVKQSLGTLPHGGTFSPAYVYDLAGNVVASTDGATPVSAVNTQFPCTIQGVPTWNTLGLLTCLDSAGRTATITSNWASYPTSLFANSSYWPSGNLQSWTQGPTVSGTPALSISQSYTNRLWLQTITASGQVP